MAVAELYFKGADGSFHTIEIDTTATISLTVPADTTETTLSITDPNATESYDFVGSKKKRES